MSCSLLLKVIYLQICEDPSNACPSVKSLMSLLEKLQQYEDELDGCSEKIEELQNALYSKDKLVSNHLSIHFNS